MSATRNMTIIAQGDQSDQLYFILQGRCRVIKRCGVPSEKLELLDDGFTTLEACAADVQLAFDNALLYNEDGAPVHKIAAEMKAIFEERYGDMHSAEQVRLRLWVRVRARARVACGSSRFSAGSHVSSASV